MYMSWKGIRSSKLFSVFYRSAAYGLIALLVLPVIAHASETNGTIDSTNAYVWSENTGWINFGTSEGNVSVTDSALSGYAWGENIGWISLNCANDNSCGSSDYKVANDGEGSLSGYAWGENIGWINFNPSGGGVTINSAGTFSGYAWGENIGWIVFNCATTDTCATTDYKITTDWRPQSVRSSGNTEAGSESSTSEDGGPDPVSEPNAAPVLGFLSNLITARTDEDTGKTITVQIHTDITVITKPVDADRLKSLTLTVGRDVYNLKPMGGDQNNPIYAATIKFTSTGLKPYTLRADYGTTDRKEKGRFLVVNEEAPAVIELPTPTSQTTRFSLPQFAPELEFEKEAEIIPIKEPQPDKPFDTTQGKPPLTPEEPTTFDKLGIVITNAFKSTTRTTSVLAKAAITVIDDLLSAAGRSIAALSKVTLAFFKAAGTFIATFTTQTYTAITNQQQSVTNAIASSYNQATNQASSTLTLAWQQTRGTFNDSKQHIASSLNPSSTPDPRIPDHLRDHRYKEVQVRIALADGTPLSGAHLTLLSEPKEAVTDDQGFASFQDVEIGEHTLKIAFGKFKGEQELFFKDDVPELLVNVTPNIVDGVHPLVTIGIALATLLIGGTLIYFFAKRRFTGHFVV